MSSVLRQLIKETLSENWGGTVDPYHEIEKIREKVEEFAVDIGKRPRSVTRQFLNDLVSRDMRVKPRYTKDPKYRRLLQRAMKLGRRRSDIFKSLYDEFRTGEASNVDF
mgnify:CR=1 FL=1